MVENEVICSFCKSCELVLQCCFNQKLTDEAEAIIKPISCTICEQRFADKMLCDQHTQYSHIQNAKDPISINPRNLSAAQLKEELKKRGLSTSGTKTILIKRLEGRLAFQL